jgi:hypothetical protein
LRLLGAGDEELGDAVDLMVRESATGQPVAVP